MEYFRLPPFLSDDEEIKIPIYRHTQVSSELLRKAHMVVQVTLNGYRIIRTRMAVRPGEVLSEVDFFYLILHSDVIRLPVTGIVIYIV